MCTNLVMRAQNGATVVGRTMEFGHPLDSQIAVLPKGFAGVSSGPSGPGKQWTADYDVIGMSAFESAQTLADGMNEKGLYAGDLYMLGFCDYTPAAGHDPSTLVAPADMVAFVLGTCATVADAKEAMKSVIVWPAVVKSLGFAPPLHLVIHDAKGASAVFEWRDSEMIVFDNPIGVATNSPHLDWHYTNLRNYITLTTKNPGSLTVNGVTLAPLGQGVGLTGLPGNTSPPARFIRAAAFVMTHEKVADGLGAEMAMFHVMNNFDIPKGSVVSADGESVEETRYTAIANLTELHYIVRFRDDPTPCLIDLTKTDFTSGARQVPRPGGGFIEMQV